MFTSIYSSVFFLASSKKYNKTQQLQNGNVSLDNDIMSQYAYNFRYSYQYLSYNNIKLLGTLSSSRHFRFYTPQLGYTPQRVVIIFDFLIRPFSDRLSLTTMIYLHLSRRPAGRYRQLLIPFICNHDHTMWVHAENESQTSVRGVSVIFK